MKLFKNKKDKDHLNLSNLAFLHQIFVSKCDDNRSTQDRNYKLWYAIDSKSND